ncbi:MAG: hypothetical protein EXR72_16910 [Myxococcales bacterium]|nr:hypothetical protein [Myxococcales bacterium]
MRSFLSLAAIFAPLLALAAGCSRKVGDPCVTNTDCSSLGDRFCDVSAPGGYCTVEGCDVITVGDEFKDTCPEDAVCVRFFQQIGRGVADGPGVQDRLCNPTTVFTLCAPAPGGTGKLPEGCCAPNERCLCDEADSKNPGQCKPTSEKDLPGHCAPESSERRTCLRKCEKDADCGRADYACRQTGTHGAEAVPTRREPATDPDGKQVTLPFGTPAMFCVQKPARPDAGM